MSRLSPTRAKAALIAELRARIQTLEAAGRGPGHIPAAPLGVPEIDGALPWGGLAGGALHEMVGAGDGAATGFASALAARLSRGGAPVLWCLANSDLHAPGLAGFSLDPERLIVVRARKDREVLWAMEEGLRSGPLAVVVGETGVLDLTASRRLQLAAETGGTIGIAVRLERAGDFPTAATTRWRIIAAPSAESLEGVGMGNARWRVELLRCRGGEVGEWLLEWDHEAHRFTVAAAALDRPARAHPPLRQAG